ncbi:MAG: hypothetical protein HFJ45_07305 [Clostridia bacterium]|nr:hypothetical protein [Clostridia bacterium]
MKKICFSVVILIILLFSLCGCKDESEEVLQKSKINSEIEYLESKILFIVNNYLNDEYYDDSQKIEWNNINVDFALISRSSSVIIMDLVSAQVNNDLMLEFEKIINDAQTALTSQNLDEFIKNICSLYGFLPEFSKQSSQNEIITKIKSMKGNLLFATYYSNINDFESNKKYLEQMESIYSELVKSQEYIEENSYKVNRIYLELQKFKMAVQDGNLAEIIDEYFELNGLL